MSSTLKLAYKKTIDPESDRLVLVDALRGFALLGILLAHISIWFDGGPLPQAVYQKYGEDMAAGITFTLLNIFVSGKFFTIFSFLFGLSFSLQLMSAEKQNNATFYFRYAWRLILLGLIGLLHHIHWRGDILSIYAMLGFALLIFSRLPDNWVLFFALFFILNVPTRVIDIYYFVANIKVEMWFNEKEMEKFYQIAMGNDYLLYLWANLMEFKTKMAFQIASGRIYITLGFFLLGLYAGRKKIFHQFPENIRFFRRLSLYSGLTMPGLLVTLIIVVFATNSFNNPNPPIWVQFVVGLLFDVFTLAMVLFYLAGITVLFNRQWWQKLLLHLAPVGKLALTSYIVQTMFGIILFYGLGFGLLGKINPAWCALMTIPVFAFQVWSSKLWLKHFRYGPLEWLWRSGTYLKWQKLSR
jgi:uncharacterized protein